MSQLIVLNQTTIDTIITTLNNNPNTAPIKATTNLPINRNYLLRLMLTKTNLISFSNFFSTLYSKPIPANKLASLVFSKNSYYSFFTPHTAEELNNANTLLINFREAKPEFDCPAIATVIIANYFPLESSKINSLAQLTFRI